jgi:hypothetical protein
VTQYSNLQISSGSIIVKLPTQQIIRLHNLIPSNITSKHFLYYVAPQSINDHKTNNQKNAIDFSKNTPLVNVLIIIFVTVAILCCFTCCYFSMQNKIKQKDLQYYFKQITFTAHKITPKIHSSFEQKDKMHSFMYTQQYNEFGDEIVSSNCTESSHSSGGDNSSGTISNNVCSSADTNSLIVHNRDSFVSVSSSSGSDGSDGSYYSDYENSENSSYSYSNSCYSEYTTNNTNNSHQYNINNNNNNNNDTNNNNIYIESEGDYCHSLSDDDDEYYTLSD